MCPLSKLAQVVPRHNLHIESIMLAKSSSNPVFEGEGDAFSRKSRLVEASAPQLEFAKISGSPMFEVEGNIFSVGKN
jgi:hypothetical protein